MSWQPPAEGNAVAVDVQEEPAAEAFGASSPHEEPAADHDGNPGQLPPADDKKKKKEPMWKRVQTLLDTASGATEAYLKPAGQTQTATDSANKAMGLATGHGGCCCCTCCATFSTATVVAITTVVTVVLMSLLVVLPVAVTQCGCKSRADGVGSLCKQLAPPLQASTANLPFYLNITGPNVAKANRDKANAALRAAVLSALAVDDPAFSAANVLGQQTQQCKAAAPPGTSSRKSATRTTTAIFEGQLVPTTSTSRTELEQSVLPDTSSSAAPPSSSSTPRSSSSPSPSSGSSSASNSTLPSSPFAAFVANQLVDVFPGATVCNSDRTGACIGEPYTVLAATSKCAAATCIAMDYSGSISNADAWPLEAAFVDKIIASVSDPASMFAVLSFAGAADYKTLISLSSRKDITATALQQIRTSNPPPQYGTDLATPIKECQSILAAASGKSKYIVLITDGVDDGVGDPIAAKNTARAAGIQIISVGVNGLNDANGVAAVDEKMLREIASGPDKVFIVDKLGNTAQQAVPSILKSTCGI